MTSARGPAPLNAKITRRGQTLLRGHALRNEGRPFVHERNLRGEYVLQRVFGGSFGRAACECGAASPLYYTTAARKQWHREHKETVRARAREQGAQ